MAPLDYLVVRRLAEICKQAEIRKSERVKKHDGRHRMRCGVPYAKNLLECAGYFRRGMHRIFIVFAGILLTASGYEVRINCSVVVAS
jgi:hypothetical protein